MARSDGQRSRATAARYAKLAELASNDELWRSYRELQRLWLKIARWADALNSDASARRRVYRTLDAVSCEMKAANH
jgi:hypothetical protein